MLDRRGSVIKNTLAGDAAKVNACRHETIEKCGAIFDNITPGEECSAVTQTSHVHVQRNVNAGDARDDVFKVELHLLTGRVREPNKRFFRNDARSTCSDLRSHGTFTDREGWIVSLADDLRNSRGRYLRRRPK